MTKPSQKTFVSDDRNGPVECLGMTFPNDQARREYFLTKLKEKLKDPEFRKIEGFPVGEDEDILALSDPPYYTICPNPFIYDIINTYAKAWDPARDEYCREPFATDVSEGKNDPIYNAHSYHTKVPHKAIMRYILHYTEPGDLIFDGFCGTGMTGVAAQFCGDRLAVESMGFKVKGDGSILDDNDQVIASLGIRRSILGDLSPAASFIAYNYNSPVDPGRFISDGQKLLSQVEEECGWMYMTLHSPKPNQVEQAISELKAGRIAPLSAKASLPLGHINYTVWSDVFSCRNCANELVFWDEAVDAEEGLVRDEFPCPHCNTILTKRSMQRAMVFRFDKALGKTIKQAKQSPVQITYTYGGKRYDKRPDSFDLSLISKIEATDIPYWYPSVELPRGFNTEQPKVSHGLSHSHHFYTTRNLYVLACLRNLLRQSDMEYQLLCLVGDQLPRASKMHKIAVSRLNTNKSKTAGVLAGTLYVPSNQIEYSVIEMIGFRIADVSSYLSKRDSSTRQFVETCSLSATTLKDNSIDYIFTDPPFGGNIMYSELNYLWESWLKVFTNNKEEAIQNSVQNKSLKDYQDIMTKCFREYYRVLKPGRWMTVEFHNSQNSVWHAIQEALEHAGFVVADVRTLDKKQGTIKQVTSSSAVKQDLIITAYKPSRRVEQRFRLLAGKEEGAWHFIHNHLQHLPVFLARGSTVEVVAERQDFLLFDRMIAFHVQRGVSVPLSASEFYSGLRRRYPERDGVFFLPEQVAEYDRNRQEYREVQQLELFVSDEKTAIQWVRRQLSQTPMTYQVLAPLYMREALKVWEKHEQPLELSVILEQNFIKDKDGTWRVADPKKEADLEQLRNRALLKEYQQYQETKGKLKVVRTEALRAGFKDCWQKGDYETIVQMAKRVPEAVIQEDPALLMYYDNALMRKGE